MNPKILNLIAKYMEKQEVLSKLTESEVLHGYNYSEIHMIATIGDMELPNVTGIAQAMHMTRGAISKITKRLMENDLIESYRVEGNNQKVFFKLTDKGQGLYKEHEIRYNLWVERDNAFLQKYSKEELDKGVSIIGVDFAGVRRGKEHTPKDQYCADRGVFIIENLCNLQSVIETGGTCFINTYPMNYADMTGLPCRVVAEI